MKAINLRSVRQTLTDLAYQHILEAILVHELGPGCRLRADELATAMSISPTPVKQALAKLEGEGLVEFRKGDGHFVVAPSDDELHDLWGCRLMCETFAVSQGIGRVDEAFLARLHEYMSECEAAMSMSATTYAAQQAYLRADTEFHRHLISLWPNAPMHDWYCTIFFKLGAYRTVRTGLGSTAVSRPKAVMSEHRQIYEALEQRDAAAATKGVRVHLNATRDALLALSHPQEQGPAMAHL